MTAKAFVAEFVGTFTLIFIGVGSLAADSLSGGNVGIVGVALAHGLAIACMVSAVAATSGGHLNPAITIAIWTIGKIRAAVAVLYIFAQCLGAIVGAALLKVVIPAAVLSSIGMGTPSVNVIGGITPPLAFLTEIITTFFLMWVIFGTAVDRSAPKMGGIFIGLTVTLDILMAGPISGAAMNPARHLGPALLGGGMVNTWVYWLGPIIGAILAAQLGNRTLRTA